MPWPLFDPATSGFAARRRRAWTTGVSSPANGIQNGDNRASEHDGACSKVQACAAAAAYTKTSLTNRRGSLGFHGVCFSRGIHATPASSLQRRSF